MDVYNPESHPKTSITNNPRLNVEKSAHKEHRKGEDKAKDLQDSPQEKKAWLAWRVGLEPHTGHPKNGGPIWGR